MRVRLDRETRFNIAWANKIQEYSIERLWLLLISHNVWTDSACLAMRQAAYD